MTSSATTVLPVRIRLDFSGAFDGFGDIFDVFSVEPDLATGHQKEVPARVLI